MIPLILQLCSQKYAIVLLIWDNDEPMVYPEALILEVNDQHLRVARLNKHRRPAT